MTTPSYWEIICTHEAGHAVASLALFGEPADIYVTLRDDGVAPYSAAFRRELVDPILSGIGRALDEVMVLAAGGKAEAVCHNILKSAGFRRDRRQINIVRGSCETACSEELSRALSVPASKLEQARGALREVVTEIESDFSRTVDLIQAHRTVLEVIAAAAHQTVESIGEDQLRDGQILLSASRLREIWDSR
jgi:hypothetical protein